MHFDSEEQTFSVFYHVTLSLVAMLKKCGWPCSGGKASSTFYKKDINDINVFVSSYGVTLLISDFSYKYLNFLVQFLYIKGGTSKLT